jgi:hypothetical protein
VAGLALPAISGPGRLQQSTQLPVLGEKFDRAIVNCRKKLRDPCRYCRPHCAADPDTGGESAPARLDADWHGKCFTQSAWFAGHKFT